VVRIDGHCEIETDYVRRCVAHLVAGEAEAVGGPLTTVGETRLSEVIAAAMSTPFGVGNSAFRTTTGRTMLTDTVAFPAYSREVLARAGRFDEELVRNQDDEYNYRLRRLGARVLLAADIRARYYSRSSFTTLWRQYAQYGYWKVRVMQKHPLQMRLRQFVPPAFVGTLLLALAFSVTSPIAVWVAAGAGGSYLIANLACSLAMTPRLGWGRGWLLPPTFAVLHVGYGLGFIWGLLRFCHRWRGRTTGERFERAAGVGAG
jgi:hypothetical protein